MSHIVDTLLTDLRLLVTDLGKDGGLISPSLYDTAQVLRLYPSEERTQPALDWLLRQQRADGGWGDPTVPYARDAPTLAAILALHSYAQAAPLHEAVQSGLDFLSQHAQLWQASLPNDIPAAVELLLPRLLHEATARGLAVPQESYRALVRLGKERRLKIMKMQPGAGTTPTYSWESWGARPDPALLDGSGSIGHSPAATAAWLSAATRETGLSWERQRAEQYLSRAADATLTGAPGVVPTAWPITRYEQSFAWYALLVAGLLHHPALQAVIRPQIADLAQALRPTGLGFTDFFIPDGDDTAAALAVLHATGYQPDLGILRRFATSQHFRTYPHELQASITTTARSVHALTLAGEDTTRWHAFLIGSQQPDGRWMGDKWNSSWIYTTWHVLLALQHSGHTSAMQAAGDALIAYQHQDGGWGMGMASTSVETAYGVLALSTLLAEGMRGDLLRRSLRRGYEWLLQRYRPAMLPRDMGWMNKELYCPPRIDRVFILCAMLAVALDNGETSEQLARVKG
ncbi:MAG TPA: hypothetical protein VFZ66_01325 [Herpetosiphonaceae bacterium]